MGSLATQRLEPAVLERDDLIRPDGVRLAVESCGPTHGSPVLFAHGFGQTRHAWRDSALRLAELGFRAVVADGRGHGASDWNPSGLPYSMDQFGTDLLALAAREARPGVLVGASMGGLLGIGVQARFQAFSALVLVDITPRWEAAGVERILAFMGAHPQGFASFDEAAEAIANYLPHRRERKRAEQLQPLLRRDPDGRYRWHWDPRMLDEVGRTGTAHQEDLENAARSLRCPVLLISGGRSDLVSKQTIDGFRALVPHAEHTEIADATHMVAGDRNDQFTDTIVEFLASLAQPAASHGASP